MTRNTLPKFAAAGTLAIAAMMPAMAQADVGCADSVRTDNTALNPSYLSCTGSFSGNMPEGTVTFGGVDYAFIGKTGNDNTGSGPFGAFSTNVNTGVLTFDEAWIGDFVLGIKAGNRYSLYHFFSTTGVSSIAFDTRGADVNVQGIGKGLSHVNLYGGEAVAAIPEPGTYALMLAGLGAVAFVARRRRGTHR